MLIYTKHDPRFYDKRLYKGGGDGGAGQMRADEEARQARVNAGVEAINAVFGQGSQMAAPDKAKFTTTSRFQRIFSQTPTYGGFFGSSRENDASTIEPEYDDVTSFDQAGYDAELARVNQHNSRVGNNAAARQRQYDDLASAVTATNVRELDKQFSRASKENKYGLARIGQLGGSVAADSEGDLQERYGEGKIRATALGSDAAANLKITDEKTRQNLISLAQSGLDTGVASNMATQQLSAAQQAANANANTATLGNLFEGLTQAYIRNQQGQYRPAPAQYNPYGGSAGLFGPGGYAGSYMK